MALQRFTIVYLAAVIVACTNTAGVNSVELNSTNFASTSKVTIKSDSIQTETESTTSFASSKVLAKSSATIPLVDDAGIGAVGDNISPANLTEARITSITFRSEEADDDKENDETISFGIRSFTVEIATPPTEKPIPLNEKVSAANKINVQQAAASSLPILTLENDQDRDDKVSNERAKVFALPKSAPAADTLSPEFTLNAKNKQEIMASSGAATAIDMNVQSPASASKSDSTNTFAAASHTAPTSNAQPTTKLAQRIEQPSRSNGNNEHEQLSIISNGMHVEQKLENGLYRIKIAEIITDEFNNGHNGDSKQILDDTISSSQKLDGNANFMHGPPVATHPSGQYNIADLYPSKLEDFSSIIRESNEKLIEEKNRFVGLEKSASNDQSAISSGRFNLIDDGNEQENAIQFGGSDGETTLDLDKQRNNKPNGAFNSIENNIPTTKIEIELIDEPGASKDDVKVIGKGDDDDYVSPLERTNPLSNSDKITDFTSELQLKDDMVSKIEQCFRESSMTNFEPKQQQPITINHPINPMGFIERRVKKFDPTLKKRMQQNAENTNRDSINTPNTKSIDENLISQSDEVHKFDAHIPNARPSANNDGKNVDTVNPNKFAENKQTNNNDANSSRSQLVDKNNKADDLVERAQAATEAPAEKTMVHGGINSAKKDLILSTLEPINATERKILFINVNSNRNATIDKNELERLQKNRQQIIKESQSNANANVHQSNRTNDTASLSTNMHLHIIHDDSIGQKSSESIKANYGNANKESSIGSKSSSTGSTTVASTNLLEAHPTEYSTLNRTTSKEPSAAAATSPVLIDAISTTESNLAKHSSSQNLIKSITQSPILTTVSPATTEQTTTSNIYNNPLRQQQQKPFGRRGFDGFYFETECDMQTPLPTDANIWRGNETHELNLPTTTPENCSGGGDCMPMIISWEGPAEIQSGDVLIVEIDDTLLLPADMNPSAAKNIDTIDGHHVATAVYQVTRPGHEHCDATEGILLDITPLVVDGKKLVTLYDKDLTEGVNLLIVVSDLWGPQCVRLKVTVKSDNCGENAQCSGKGVCFSNASMEGYECQCCSGFAGSHCEEIDACSPSPCTNNGICVDLSQGHDGNSYQCLCPYGYTGKNCQFESDPCQNGECQNGGRCSGNSTHFRIECAPGFTGPLCQHNLNECESSPCVHGICVDQEDGFRCFCQPGFSGELCNYEYNECDSNPCLNDGQCTDHIGGFSCKCTRGFTGKRCHIKVDFCANNPCPEGHQCMDHGNDFSCECPEGRSGLDCNQIPRTKCNVNPCANGGTCWTSDESFYCACHAGFTGKMCEDEFILDAVVNTNDIVSDPDGETSHARPFGESSFSAVISKGTTVGLHNAYIAVGTFATAIFIVAIVVSAPFSD